MSLEATIYKSSHANKVFTKNDLNLGYAVGYYNNSYVNGKSAYLWRNGAQIILDWMKKKFEYEMFMVAFIMTDELWALLENSNELDEDQLQLVSEFRSNLLEGEVAWIQIA